MSKRNANGKKQKLDRGESLATMKKVLHYLAAYRVLFVLSLLLAAVVVVLMLYLPILTGRAIDLLVGQGEVDPDGRLPGILLTAGIVILVTAVCQWLKTSSTTILRSVWCAACGRMPLSICSGFRCPISTAVRWGILSAVS